MRGHLKSFSGQKRCNFSFLLQQIIEAELFRSFEPSEEAPMQRTLLILFLSLILSAFRSISYANAGGGGGGGARSTSSSGGSTNPSNTDASGDERAQQAKLAGDLYQKGVDAGNDGDFAKAISFFQDSLKLNPDNPDALNMLAHAQRKIGLINEAIENYWKALQLRPDFPEAREYMGEAYIQAALKEMDTLKGYG